MKRAEIGPARRFAVLARDNFRCRYCGRASGDVELVIDHVVPLCQGGTNDLSNLAAACRECNGGKGGLTIGQAVAADGSAPEDPDQIRMLICGNFKGDVMDGPTLETIIRYAEESGVGRVLQWMDIAGALVDLNDGAALLRCISGMRHLSLWLADDNQKGDEDA